jgi:hypothetical protein
LTDGAESNLWNFSDRCDLFDGVFAANGGGPAEEVLEEERVVPGEPSMVL